MRPEEAILAEHTLPLVGQGAPWAHHVDAQPMLAAAAREMLCEALDPSLTRLVGSRRLKAAHPLDLVRADTHPRRKRRDDNDIALRRHQMRPRCPTREHRAMQVNID